MTEIHLLDGSLLKGRIISRSNNIIQFEYKSSVIRINQEKVREIINIPDQAISLRTREGTVLKGYLVSEDRETIKILTSKSNEMVLIRTNLAAIELNGMRVQPDLHTPMRLVDKDEFFFDGRNAFRSAVLPSWGQFHQAHYIRGGIVAGGFAVSAAIMVTSLINFSSLKNDYVNVPTDAKYASLKGYYYQFYVSAGFLVLSYIYGILDAGIQARRIQSASFGIPEMGRCIVLNKRVEIVLIKKNF